MRRVLVLSALLLAGLALATDPPTSPPVDAAHADAVHVAFDTTEGTWMNVDVSPDGETIAFDLLGHVYTLPIAGGTATRLTSGTSWNMHPRFSPDGKRLAFTSDRGGGDNLWVMDVDGKNPKPITDESFRLVTQPEWSPDGRWIFGRKHFTGTRSLGTGEIWAWSSDGKGKGVQWTQKGNDQADVNEPAISPDGRWLYMSEAGAFDYNRNVYEGIYGISRKDLLTGEVEPVADGAGGAIRPEVSPDGKTLGYLRRALDGQRTEWIVRDLATGSERVAFGGLDRDQQETWAIHGTYPMWSWLPDNKAAVFSFGGGLHRVRVDGVVTDIPFTASVARDVRPAVRQPHEVAPTSFDAKAVRWSTLSPDGQTVAFQAVGRVWIESVGGAPLPISPSDVLGYAPAWRGDGRAVAFTTWDDADGGMLWVQNVRGDHQLGAPKPLGDSADLYTNPSFSADGKRVVWAQGTGLTNRGQSGGNEPWLRIRWREGDGPIHDAGHVALRGAGDRPPRPTFSADGARILVTDADGDDTTLISMALDGTDRRVLARSGYAAEIAPSPDGKWIAWKALHRAYVAAWPPTAGAPLVLGEPGDSVPAVRLSAELGEWLRWSDADTLTYAAGPTMYRVELANGLPEAAKAPDTKPTDATPWPVHTLSPLGTPIPINLHVNRTLPEGEVAIVGAKIITMRASEVIDDGVIVVRGERIVAIGPRASTPVPAGAKVIDAKGKSVFPGMVDVHAHMGYGYADVSPETIASYAANLAYGVTTTHDPSADTHFVFAQHELMEAGRIVGPRIFSTGFILYGAENDEKAPIESLDDAREHVRRIADYGGFSVKSYNQPRRDQRQWVLDAAREEGLLVVPEGGSTLAHNLTMVIDGHTGIEHALPVEQLHTDVLKLWAANAGVHYTPTLLVGYGGVWGENAFYQREDVWKDARLQHWTVPGKLEARSKRRTLTPEEDWHHVRLARTAWELEQAGVPVNLGAHGQLQGLGPHWEMWAMTEGGFPAIEALRVATWNGATYLGLDKDIGSLDLGKLADLVIVDGDVLADIHRSRDVFRVMKGGVVYDPDTLATVWPTQGPPLATPWLDAVTGGQGIPWIGEEEIAD